MEKIEIPNPLPLFPLPTTVLFPKIHLPLHIFEPRYREMVRDAQAGEQLIGMVLLKEGWEEEYEKNPPVHEIGCVGRMLYVQPFEDGRFNIVLFGMSRFRLQGQFFDRSYRQGWVDPITEDPIGGSIPPALLSELITQVREYGRLRGWQRQIESVMDLKLDNERLVNLFSAELDFTPLEKQFLLESENVLVQTKRLLDLLGFYIQEHKATQSRIKPPSDTRSAS
jgi:Lon protease-like protein